MDVIHKFGEKNPTKRIKTENGREGESGYKTETLEKEDDRNEVFKNESDYDTKFPKHVTKTEIWGRGLDKSAIDIHNKIIKSRCLCDIHVEMVVQLMVVDMKSDSRYNTLLKLTNAIVLFSDDCRITDNEMCQQVCNIRLQIVGDEEYLSTLISLLGSYDELIAFSSGKTIAAILQCTGLKGLPESFLNSLLSGFKHGSLNDNFGLFSMNALEAVLRNSRHINNNDNHKLNNQLSTPLCQKRNKEALLNNIDVDPYIQLLKIPLLNRWQVILSDIQTMDMQNKINITSIIAVLDLYSEMLLHPTYTQTMEYLKTFSKFTTILEVKNLQLCKKVLDILNLILKKSENNENEQSSFGCQGPACGCQGTMWGNQGIVCGNQTTVCGNQTTVCSNQATMSGNQATVCDKQATVNGNQTTVSGYQATMSGKKATVCSNQATVSGNQATVSGKQATVCGNHECQTLASNVINLLVIEKRIWTLPYSPGFIGFGGAVYMETDDDNDIPVISKDMSLLRNIASLLLRSCLICFLSITDNSCTILKVLKELSTFMRQKLAVQHGQSLSSWLFLIFQDNDDSLVSAMLLSLKIYSVSYRARWVYRIIIPNHIAGRGYSGNVHTESYQEHYIQQSPRCSAFRDICCFCNPHQIFIAFLQMISFDHSVLLDWLISEETEFLEYFLKYLKFLVHDWKGFLRAEIAVEDTERGDVFITKDFVARSQGSFTGQDETVSDEPALQSYAESLDKSESRYRDISDRKEVQSDPEVTSDEILDAMKSTNNCTLYDVAANHKIDLHATKFEGRNSPEHQSEISFATTNHKIDLHATKVEGRSSPEHQSEISFATSDKIRFQESMHVELTMSLLYQLKAAIEKLQNKQLFPYSPKVLIKLLNRAETLHRNTTDYESF
ncbi:uncharacterized protein LOC144349975 [Saccoglossus kowalevskii]